MRDAFHVGSIHYESKWEGVGPWKSWVGVLYGAHLLTAAAGDPARDSSYIGSVF
jgi:hypothetical protein